MAFGRGNKNNRRMQYGGMSGGRTGTRGRGPRLTKRRGSGARGLTRRSGSGARGRGGGNNAQKWTRGSFISEFNSSPEMQSIALQKGWDGGEITPSSWCWICRLFGGCSSCTGCCPPGQITK